MYISEYRVTDDILIINVKSEADFDGLKNEMIKNSEELSSLYRKEKCAEISILGGSFSNEQIRILENVIYQKVKKSIASARSGRKIIRNSSITRFEGLARPFDEQETKRLFERVTAPVHSRSPKKTEMEIPENKNYAEFRTGSMRSGQKIESKGSVIIFGDVNPGAEIKAGENIIVLGKLKGVARAGMNGDTQCYVAAVELAPEQLIITNIVADFQRSLPGSKLKSKIKNQKKQTVPEYAHTDGEQIFIDPLV